MGQQQPQQLSPDQIAAPQPETLPNSPTVPPNSTGSVQNLESIASQVPQQLGQALQNQQQPQQQGQWSDNNPYAAIAKDYLQRWQAARPPPTTGGTIKRTLTNFFGGMSHGMLPVTQTPEFQRNELLGHLLTTTNMAQQWEEAQGQQRYRQTLTDQMKRETARF
jgi:hypothetical protein